MSVGGISVMGIFRLKVKQRGTIVVDGVDSLEEAKEYIESCNPVDAVSHRSDPTRTFAPYHAAFNKSAVCHNIFSCPVICNNFVFVSNIPLFQSFTVFLIASLWVSTWNFPFCDIANSVLYRSVDAPHSVQTT